MHTVEGEIHSLAILWYFEGNQGNSREIAETNQSYVFLFIAFKIVARLIYIKCILQKEKNKQTNKNTHRRVYEFILHENFKFI